MSDIIVDNIGIVIIVVVVSILVFRAIFRRMAENKMYAGFARDAAIRMSQALAHPDVGVSIIPVQSIDKTRYKEMEIPNVKDDDDFSKKTAFMAGVRIPAFGVGDGTGPVEIKRGFRLKSMLSDSSSSDVLFMVTNENQEEIVFPKSTYMNIIDAVSGFFEAKRNFDEKSWDYLKALEDLQEATKTNFMGYKLNIVDNFAHNFKVAVRKRQCQNSKEALEEASSLISDMSRHECGMYHQMHEGYEKLNGKGSFEKALENVFNTMIR